MMKYNEKYNIIVRRSDGYFFQYESEKWAILSVEGADFTKIEVFKEPRGFGNGDIITGKRKLSREVSITVVARDIEEYPLIRDEIMAFHNSNYTFDLEITYQGRTLNLKEAEISDIIYPTERYGRNAILAVSFLSPYSDLFANSVDSTDFSSSKALWHDTRVYEGKAGKLAFSEIVRTTEKTINYLGSEPASPIITVTATGYVPGITIEIGDLKTEIKTNLYKGDVLKIDCEKKSVYKNGALVSLSNYNLWDIAALKIKYGDNHVKIYNTQSSAFHSEISYIGRYGGL